jgi:CRISPR-associated endonuclease Csn1
VTHEFEIDHILPRSRSHDNSYENKILVHKRCNQNKKNSTPFEFSEIGNGDATSPGWQRFTATLSTIKGIRKQKRRNLLNTTFAEDEAKFASRHLNDTRYISRLVTRYLHALYEMVGEPPITEKGSSKRVFVQPGALTALVRKSWGLENLKKDLHGNRLGDKHHAVDALICALLSEGQRQFITRREQGMRDAAKASTIFSKFSRSYELMEQRNDQCRTPRDVSPPWEGFRHDVAAAVDLFTVSRRENRKGRGGLHNDTLYRVENEDGKEVCYSRKPIVDTSTGKGKGAFQRPADLDRIKDIHLDRNLWLKTALTNWIDADAPVEIDRLPRDPQGAIIRKVTVRQGKKSGRKYPQGYVSGGDQVRLDVFSKQGKRGETAYHLVPVYSHHLIQSDPPTRAIVANVDEDQWNLIDDSYEFEFSLWPNSRFHVQKNGGEEVIGTYCGVHRGTARIEYANPDDQSENPSPPKGGRKTPGVSVKTGVTRFQKIEVDRLGREFPIVSEKRTWRGKTVS